MSFNILKDDRQRGQYLRTIFSEKGEETLTTYLKNLIKWYLVKLEDEYPFKQGIILGIPLFKYSDVINDKEALGERIKIIAQLLGKKGLLIKTANDTTVVFNVESLKEGKEDNDE